MITTVVFDLDDTLYNEIDYCRSGFCAVSRFLAETCTSQSAELIFNAFWEQFTAGNHTTTFNSALDDLGIAYDTDFIVNLIKVYRDHKPNITLPDDSRDVLCMLKKKYTLALLTDGFLPAQQLKVEALGIEKFFKSIMYTEQLGRQFWKPSTVGFEKLLKTLNAKSDNTVYIADNEKKDFIAPNKLGFLTIQLLRPCRLHTESGADPAAAAKAQIHKISELPTFLEQF